MSERPGLAILDFGQRRQGPPKKQSNSGVEAGWPIASQRVTTNGNGTVEAEEQALNDFIRSESHGKLKLSPNSEFHFQLTDLEDLGQIGGGAFGVVQKMKHKETGKVMAVKRIRSMLEQKDQKQMLMDLDVTMRSDRCPYIVQFYGAIFREGDCWICMELMDISLDKLYKTVFEKLNERMPEEIIGKIAVATLLALNYLKEELEIIHRDVKPSNILLDRKGNIKLCDFGIAGKLVDSIVKTKDVGCRPYMSPERLSTFGVASQIGYGVTSDVWSYGITLVEIATGRFPYPAWSTIFEQINGVINGDPPIVTMNDGYSVEFCQLVRDCLSKDPKLRPNFRKLLNYDFITTYTCKNVDVAKFVERALKGSWVSFS